MEGAEVCTECQTSGQPESDQPNQESAVARPEKFKELAVKPETANATRGRRDPRRLERRNIVLRIHPSFIGATTVRKEVGQGQKKKVKLVHDQREQTAAEAD